MTPSSTVIVPASTESSRTRRPLIVVMVAVLGLVRLHVGCLHVELHVQGVSVGRVDGSGGLDPPAVPIHDDPLFDEERVAGPDSSRRASSAVAAAAAMVPVPRRSTKPARASVSCREPCARSAVITASAQSRTSTADSMAIGSSSANRSRRRWTTG